MSDKILIVDDERDIARMVEVSLIAAGFHVTVARTGREALDRARSEAPALILLDLMLPDLSGTEVCRALRGEPKTRSTPILMLTARGEEIDRVVGFEVGADDYVVKPFSPRELVLRVRALLKRSAGRRDADPEERGSVEFGDLLLDAARHRVTIGGDEVALTALEFRLLDTLLRRRGRVQSRARLLDDVWGADVNVTDRTVDTHVKRLREKLGARGEWLETVRGVGYRFRESPSGTLHVG